MCRYKNENKDNSLCHHIHCRDRSKKILTYITRHTDTGKLCSNYAFDVSKATDKCSKDKENKGRKKKVRNLQQMFLAILEL